MEEETKEEIKCIICNEDYYKIVTIPKGLSKQMFNIEDGKIPICRKCDKEQLITLMRCLL